MRLLPSLPLLALVVASALSCSEDKPDEQSPNSPPVEAPRPYDAVPETGRLHQIRRHLKHLGHPLIGDVRYGSGTLNRHYRAEYGLHRLALHACSIRFEHPRTGLPLQVDAPMPDDLGDALDRLGLPRGDGGGCAPTRGESR